MKKINSLVIAFLAIITISAQSTSIYDAYVITNTNGAGNVYTQLNSFSGANLGTFNNTQSLVISGGQNKTSKCSGGDVTGGNINYRFYNVSNTPGSFVPISMNWVSNDSSSNGCGSGNQTWEKNNSTTNILTGLPNGTYVLEIYTDAPGTPSTAYYSNFANNFKANFTINNSILGVDDINALKTKSIISEGKLITSQKGNLNLQIYDFSGRIIKTIKVKANGNAIELNLNKKGNYLVKISNGKENEVLKFVY